MKKLFTIFMTLLLALTIVTTPQTVFAAPRISHSSITLNVGKSKTIKIKGTKKRIVWKSSNKSIATVSYGKVYAKKKGSCKITAKVAGKSFICKVTVTAKPKPTTAYYEETPVSDNVYITQTGSKYHETDSCRGLNNANAIYECSLSSAESQGFTPCAWCY